MNERLKTLLNSRQATVVPGAFNALTAKNAADAGFEAVYLTGAGVTNAYLGIPDVGLISLSERQARHRAPDRGAPARCGGRSLPAVGVAGSELRHEVVRVGDGHDPVADRELALERFLRGIVLDAEEPPEVHARLVEWPTDIVLDSTGLKFFGAGEWARAKHGETRRSWRKLHISVDPASSEIRTHELTGDDTADATMAGPLVAGSGGMIRRVFANGAYDGEPVTKAIREARPPNSPPEIIIPPRATSIPPPGHASWRIGTAAPCGGDRVEGKDELAETTGLRIESAWRNSHGSHQEAQRRQAHRSHIPIPTNRNRHADRRTQSLYPCGETKHNQDPLTNRGMGDHTIAAPCTKAIMFCYLP